MLDEHKSFPEMITVVIRTLGSHCCTTRRTMIIWGVGLFVHYQIDPLSPFGEEWTDSSQLQLLGFVILITGQDTWWKFKRMDLWKNWRRFCGFFFSGKSELRVGGFRNYAPSCMILDLVFFVLCTSNDDAPNGSGDLRRDHPNTGPEAGRGNQGKFGGL